MLNGDRGPFKVLYHVHEDVSPSNWSVVKWNLRRWEGTGFSDWKQKLRTLRMIGNKAVDLKAYDERRNIQYSVFGNKYVQVQGEHNDGAIAKYVWLIRSENVNELLSESGERPHQIHRVDENAFAEVVSNIFSNSARAILKKVSSSKSIKQGRDAVK